MGKLWAVAPLEGLTPAEFLICGSIDIWGHIIPVMDVLCLVGYLVTSLVSTP